jgi:hypothetical protein
MTPLKTFAAIAAFLFALFAYGTYRVRQHESSRQEQCESWTTKGVETFFYNHRCYVIVDGIPQPI